MNRGTTSLLIFSFTSFNSCSESIEPSIILIQPSKSSVLRSITRQSVHYLVGSPLKLHHTHALPTVTMGSTELPYMKTNPKIIFFTDFDGTITLADSNDFLTDNLGYGREKRRQGNYDVLHGKTSFRDAFRDMLDSVKTPFNKCIEVLQQNMELDPWFVEFYYWAEQNNVPIVVLSSGMNPIISALFESLLGHKPRSHLHIVSNEVESRDGKDINTEGGWQIKYRDDTHFGHDKSLEIKPYAELPEDKRPTLLYAGDGVSDLSAAAETDLLFAKKGHDLVAFCERQGVPFTTFESWETILDTTKDILSGKVSLKKVAEEGVKKVHEEGKAVPPPQY